MTCARAWLVSCLFCHSLGEMGTRKRENMVFFCSSTIRIMISICRPTQKTNFLAIQLMKSNCIILVREICLIDIVYISLTKIDWCVVHISTKTTAYTNHLRLVPTLAMSLVFGSPDWTAWIRKPIPPPLPLPSPIR